MDTTYDFTITKMQTVNAPATSTGNSLMATFDMRVAGIKIGGCVLVRRKNGKIVMSGPKGKTHTGHEIVTHIEDRGLREAVAEKAAKVYESFTGRCLKPEVEA